MLVRVTEIFCGEISQLLSRGLQRVCVSGVVVISKSFTGMEVTIPKLVGFLIGKLASVECVGVGDYSLGNLLSCKMLKAFSFMISQTCFLNYVLSSLSFRYSVITNYREYLVENIFWNLEKILFYNFI